MKNVSTLDNLSEPLGLVGPVILAVSHREGGGEAEAVQPVLVAAGVESGAREKPVGLASVIGVEGCHVQRRQAEEVLAHRLHVPHRMLRNPVVDHLLAHVRNQNASSSKLIKTRWLMHVVWLIWTDQEEAELLAGIQDGAADLVMTEGEVDNGEGDRRRQDRQLVGRGGGEQFLHGNGKLWNTTRTQQELRLPVVGVS